jgi:hypothetical protein
MIVVPSEVFYQPKFKSQYERRSHPSTMTGARGEQAWQTTTADGASFQGGHRLFPI